MPAPVHQTRTESGGAAPPETVIQRPVLPRRRRRRRRPEMLKIGGRISTPAFIGIAASTFVILLAVWWLVTKEGWEQPLFLPSPQSVWNTLVAQWNNGQLASDTGVSVYRIMIGFLIASVMAIPIGVLIGTYRVWEAALEPLIDFIRYMPVVAFVPLTIVWSGVGDTQKFLIIWIGTFFQQVLLIMDNTKRVPLDFVDIGRTLGLKDRHILSRIIVRSAAPGIWDSLRVSLGWAWTWLVVAELVAATSGLGYRITTAQRYLETNLIIAYILVLGVLGLVLDQAMKAIGRALFRYAEQGR
jgi:NitT/TauT family transport system permease protein